MGRRLKELTQNNTKCMVKVNGVTLIERLLSQLEKYELSRIVIVVGYEGQKLVDCCANFEEKYENAKGYRKLKIPASGSLLSDKDISSRQLKIDG